jgi:membrane fusion protein (multidrug efflux system)
MRALDVEGRGPSAWAICGLAALLLAGLAGCRPGEGEGKGKDAKGGKPGAEDGAKAEEELVPVEVAELRRGPMEAVLRYSTNLEAESSVQVFAQAQRLVTHLLVEEGQRVGRGQVLVRLQDDEQKSAIARIESQLVKLRREGQRQENLFQQKLISEQAYNEAKYQVEQLEIAQADAQRELTYTEVRAPIAGMITARRVNLGDNVKVGQHLFDIVDFNTIVARVFIPERQLARLRLGQPARVASPSLGGSVTQGSLLRIAPTVDPKSGTVKVTVKVPPSSPGLLPGMYVEVELVVDTKTDALLLPKRALVYDDTDAFVYRLKADSTVERLRVNPVLEDRDTIEPAAADGLQPGDKVVIAGQAGLKSGTKVRLAGKLTEQAGSTL